jgi:hypothetical protein
MNDWNPNIPAALFPVGVILALYAIDLLNRHFGVGQERHEGVSQFARCPVDRSEAWYQAQDAPKVTSNIRRIHRCT